MVSMHTGASANLAKCAKYCFQSTSPRPWRSSRGVAVLAWPRHRVAQTGVSIGCQILRFSNGSSSVHTALPESMFTPTQSFRPPRPTYQLQRVHVARMVFHGDLDARISPFLLALSNFTVSSMRASIPPSVRRSPRDPRSPGTPASPKFWKCEFPEQDVPRPYPKYP